jgi:predicted ArsR family transcriptional regulator
MLRHLLQLVARDEAVRSTELASALGVSAALVDSMLEELAQRGYLRLVAAGCTACARCPARAACLFGNAARVWVPTERATNSSGRVRAAEPTLT